MRLLATAGPAAGHGRCYCALLCSPERDVGRGPRRGTRARANAPNQRWAREWWHTTHGSTELAETRRHRRRRRRPHGAYQRTSPARQLFGHRGGSRRMYARFVTGSSAGRADSAKRCVPTRRCRASVIRRGSAERPRDNSQRLYAESDRDRVIRCVVFRDVAGSGASIDVRLRDANDRRWLAGSAPALPATGATTTAKTAKTDGQPGGSAYWNERGRRVGDAGQESRAGGLDASPQPIGGQHPS